MYIECYGQISSKENNRRLSTCGIEGIKLVDYHQRLVCSSVKDDMVFRLQMKIKASMDLYDIGDILRESMVFALLNPDE